MSTLANKIYEANNEAVYGDLHDKVEERQKMIACAEEQLKLLHTREYQPKIYCQNNKRSVVIAELNTDWNGFNRRCLQYVAAKLEKEVPPPFGHAYDVKEFDVDVEIQVGLEDYEFAADYETKVGIVVVPVWQKMFNIVKRKVGLK